MRYSEDFVRTITVYYLTFSRVFCKGGAEWVVSDGMGLSYYVMRPDQPFWLGGGSNNLNLKYFHPPQSR